MLMSDAERINALDFVISVLREHEKALDSIAQKLEEGLKSFREMPKQAFTLFSCVRWSQFKEASEGAEAVSFKLDDELEIRALKGNFIYKYKEAIFGREEEGGCGLLASLKPRLDSEEVRDWTAKELKVPKNRVIEGEIRLSP